MLMRTNVFPLAFLDIRDSVSSKEICFVYKYLAPLYFYNIIAYIYIHIYFTFQISRTNFLFFFLCYTKDTKLHNRLHFQAASWKNYPCPCKGL